MSATLDANLNVISEDSTIEIQYMEGDLNIIQKLDDEPNDVGGLTSAQLKAKFDEAGNVIKEYINETLIPAILEDDATEAARTAAENERRANEQERVNNENNRVSSEESRGTAEQNRTVAEQNRVAAEQNRVDVERGRVLTEQSRAQAETERVSNENARKAAETERTKQESSRQTAETNRKNAEDARVEAENNRKSAETGRVNAETSRNSTFATQINQVEQATKNAQDAVTNLNATVEQAAQQTAAGVEKKLQSYVDAAALAEENSKKNAEASALSEANSKTSEQNSKQSEETALEAANLAAQKAVEVSGYASDAPPPIVQGGSGTVIAASDSAERPLKGLRLFGKTTVIPSCAGKNLFPVPNEAAVTTTVHGITFTQKTDGTIILDGTATAVTALYLPLEQTIPAGTSFAMSMNNSAALGSDSSTSVAMRLIDQTAHSSSLQFGTTYAVCSVVNATAVATESFDALGVQVRVNTGVTLNNFVIKPQVEIGTVATEYELTPPPDPDYPQEFVNAGDGGTIKATACGRNLLDIGTMAARVASSAIDFVDEDTIRVYSKADGTYCAANSPYMKFRAGVTYVFSLHADTITSGELRFGFRKKSTHFFLTDSMPITTLGRVSVTYTPAETVEGYLSVLANWKDATVWGDVTVSQLQLEIGSTATEYEPYSGGTLTFQTPNGLPGIPVTSGGNYTDANGQQWVCDEKDGTRGKNIQRIGQIHLDGSTAPADVLVRTNSVRVIYSGYENASDVPSLRAQRSNRLPSNAVYSQDLVGFVVARDGAGACILGLPLDAGSTKDEVQAWIAEHPIDIQYILETPIETDLTAAELAAYAALHTNYPNTTVFNDEGAWMGMEYVADTKIYIDNKFAALNAAILSLGGNV